MKAIHDLCKTVLCLSGRIRIFLVITALTAGTVFLFASSATAGQYESHTAVVLNSVSTAEETQRLLYESTVDAVPVRMSFAPRAGGIAIAVVLICAVLAAVVILWAKFSDKTVTGAEQIAKLFSVPVLGEIWNIPSDSPEISLPRRIRILWNEFSKVENRNKLPWIRKLIHSRGRNIRGSDAWNQEKYLILNETVPSDIIEAYQILRTNIIYALENSDRKIFAVSSPASGEGKSITAANLALSFARTAGRVLLIDADMRTPVIHRLFHTDNGAGLSTLMISLSSIEESILPGAEGQPDILPAGPLPPNPSELLASEQFRDLLETLSGIYDYIIIDTPPVNPVSDALTFGQSVGGILLVARYAFTMRKEITQTVDKANVSGVNILGVVLNDVDSDEAGYYEYSA